MFHPVNVIERSMMVLLLAVALPACGSGDDGAEYWENEREIIALTQRLKLGEYRLGRFGPEGGKKLDDLKTRLSENETGLCRLQKEKATLAAEIACLKTRNQELGRMVLEQKRSKTRGMKFETFPARDGRIFENATVIMVEDSGVEFRHDHGAVRLLYGELSDQQRLFFGLEESAALAAEDRERREALAYERDIDLELEAIRKRETHATNLDGMNLASRFSRSLSPVSFRKPVISELSKPAKPVGSASFYLKYRRYYGYHSHRPVYRYVSRHVPACVRTSSSKSSTCASMTNIP